MLNLKQVIFVIPRYGVIPKNPSNTTAAKRGTQQAAAAPPKQASFAYNVFNSAYNGVKRFIFG
jgi:hypothetical protein